MSPVHCVLSPSCNPEALKLRAGCNQILPSIEVNKKKETSPTKTAVETKPPLEVAVCRGNVEFVGLLLKHGEPIGPSLLPRILASDKALELLKVVRGYLDLGARNEQGNNALHLVCNTKHGYKRQKELAKFLLDAGVDVNQANDTGYTPLHYSICVDSKPLFSLFLKRGADIHQRGNKGRTSLHLACLLNRTGMIRELLRRGSDINAQDELGKTPLHLVGSTDSPSVKTLLKHMSGLYNENERISCKNWKYMEANPIVMQWFEHFLKKRQHVVPTKSRAYLNSLMAFFGCWFFIISYLMILLFF